MKVSLQDKKAVTWDSATKTAISVRDGVLEYYGAEIGIEPADKIFTVYRSPATIANVALKMSGLPLTNEHVDVQPFVDESAKVGLIQSSDMIDMLDEATSSTLAIRNSVSLTDAIMADVGSGKRELSLGYDADLVPHNKYDFEQRDIIPYHLAVVQAGRCGPACRFIDHKPKTEDDTMKRSKLASAIAAITASKGFKDADGSITVEQIAELAMSLPEALKTAPLEKLQEMWPALMELITMSKDAGVEMEGIESVVETEDEEKPAEEVEVKDEDKDEDKKPMADSKAFKDALSAAVKSETARYATVVEKARNFLPAGYSFADKSADKIMADAVATQYKESFAGAELSTAFKLLRKPVDSLQKFGDAAADGGVKTLVDRVNAHINQ